MSNRRIVPGPGQESVWDYPRPPALEDCAQRIRVLAGGLTIADSIATKRVLETSHPPVYYVPPNDVVAGCLVPSQGRSFCEWKGEASYYSVVVNGKTIEQAAWCYSDPTLRFASIAGYLAFYPGRMEDCFVDDERVDSQAGDFYGGWITSRIVGPFKGAPGTFGW